VPRLARPELGGRACAQARGPAPLLLQRHAHRRETGHHREVVDGRNRLSRVLVGYRFTRADVDFLSSAAGQAALTEGEQGAAWPAGALVRDLERLRAERGERAAALVETVRLRRRAGVKLDGAGEWLFTDDALQQATPAVVARHRSRRLAGRVVHDVTCSV